MARAQFNVHVIPYRLGTDGVEFALFRRADDGNWLGITGGGEDAETPLAAAKRETWEECGLQTASFIKLDAVTPIPAHVCTAPHWPKDLYIIFQHAFGVDATGHDLVLCDEHTTYQWVSYAQAQTMLRWDNTKVDLWELNERLIRAISKI